MIKGTLNGWSLYNIIAEELRFYNNFYNFTQVGKYAIYRTTKQTKVNLEHQKGFCLIDFLLYINNTYVFVF